MALTAVLPDLFYRSACLSEEEQRHFLAHLYRAASTTAAHRWTSLRHRRLVMFGGSPDARGMIATESLPSWLMRITAGTTQVPPPAPPPFLTSSEVGRRNPEVGRPNPEDGDTTSSQGLTFLSPSPTTAAGSARTYVSLPRWNHVLVNEYTCPAGIMAHEDGPLYHDSVAIYSFASAVPLVFLVKERPGDEGEGNHQPPSSATTTGARDGRFEDIYDDDDDPSPGSGEGPTSVVTAPPCTLRWFSSGTQRAAGRQTAMPPVVVVLAAGSVVVFRRAWYHAYLHAVPDAYDKRQFFQIWDRYRLSGRGSDESNASATESDDTAMGIAVHQEDVANWSSLLEDERRPFTSFTCPSCAKLVVWIPRAEKRVSATFRHHKPPLLLSQTTYDPHHTAS